MIVKKIVPVGWPCSLDDCPSGPFIPLAFDSLCFKSEYRTDSGKIEAFNEAGEFYHGSGLVQPVEMLTEEQQQ